MDLRTKVTTCIIALAVLLLAVSSYFYFTSAKSTENITSFADCKKAGYPILESYPAQCKTPDGKTFTEDIGNEQEKSDFIMLDTPRPNQTIRFPLEIRGKARGTWFFEASFPVKLVDEGGFLIAQGNAQAVGEWMTEDFVPFTAELSGSLPESGKGLIILERSNPSGLPENADQLEVPVVF
jgi:hypothetical protein